MDSHLEWHYLQDRDTFDELRSMVMNLNVTPHGMRERMQKFLRQLVILVLLLHVRYSIFYICIKHKNVVFMLANV